MQTYFRKYNESQWEVKNPYLLFRRIKLNLFGQYFKQSQEKISKTSFVW